MLIERQRDVPHHHPHRPLSQQISGRVVTASDPDWDAIRQVFNLTTDLSPVAIVLPKDADDVTAAVRYAQRRG